MKRLERFQTIFLIAGIGFFLLSFLGMGLAPWTTLKGLQLPEGMTARTPEEEQGREIFMQEACWHCHTQFVRPVAGESLRYGPVSTAEEHALEIPQLFGTRRVGPDLARESGKRSDDWQLAHLYNPRGTVPWSIMPAFPWMFEEKDGQLVPTDKARALVAYIQSIGRNTADQMKAANDDYRRNFVAGHAPEKSDALLERGHYLYARECSGCHGKTGNADGISAKLLVPAAANLTKIQPSAEYIYTILNTGIPGSAMPHFRDYKPEDLWAISFYVQTLSPETDIASTGSDMSSSLLERGKQQFAALCATCHGPSGAGDGPVGAALVPSPPAFTKLRPTTDHILKILETGVPGTAMVPFAQLPEEDRQALAYFVRQLSEGKVQ
ncbi:MAG: hypothetical protein COV45_01180 [Deltaproteobacteria bacterium CG11_big_fil_rev_8_21_14_0_20_47_16]|nr:MAG: hypothetical protein COV45_01180 [Deltaproteobacteria bacterium CG11_big_fil_rev_8_21_14_0_20_47_16]